MGNYAIQLYSGYKILGAAWSIERRAHHGNNLDFTKQSIEKPPRPCAKTRQVDNRSQPAGRGEKPGPRFGRDGRVARLRRDRRIAIRLTAGADAP